MDLIVEYNRYEITNLQIVQAKQQATFCWTLKLRI